MTTIDNASRPTTASFVWPRVTFIRFSMLAMMVLIVSSWIFVLNVDGAQSHSFLSVETFNRFKDFLGDLLGIGSSTTPAFAQWSEWRSTGHLAYDTLAMSVMAIGFAAIFALVFFIFGARNMMMGEMAPYGSWFWRGVFFLVRGLFVVTRAIPELIWAMLIIFVLSPGLLPGAVALGLHNAGILGKLSSEIVEGLDQRPIQALRSTGAGRFQVMVYGVLPQALPRFVTYLFYRWEVIIRTAIVVGFVSAGGLGTEFRLSMSYFHFTTVALLLIWYLILVLGVDIAASYLRRLAR
ncbi:MAG: ABC transporter permease subunit [Chloroflexi bacterium]|nr:ABC transporter permease subunit [Chloroflexota bacterium]